MKISFKRAANHTRDIQFELSESSSMILHLIRALASQLVLIGHGINLFNIFVKFRHPYAPYIDEIAVVIFFLLSGFLITHTVVRKVEYRGYTFMEYFIDRFFRIYSGFIPALFFVIGADLLQIIINKSHYIHYQAFNFLTFVGNIIMFQDHPLNPIMRAIFDSGSPIYSMFKITSFGSGRPFWTLAIEWWIYLCFGWLVLGNAWQKKRKFLFLVILGFFSLVPIFNLLGGRGHGLTMVWLMGLVVYFGLANRYLKKLSATHSILLSVFFLIIAFRRVYTTKIAYDVLFAAITAWSFLFLIHATQFNRIIFSSRLKKIIRFVADYSLMLYLIHYSIQEVFMLFKSTISPYILFVLSFILSNILAAWIASFTEMRRHYWADRLKAWLVARYGSRFLYR